MIGRNNMSTKHKDKKIQRNFVFFLFFFVSLCLNAFSQNISDYNVIWTSQSKNSSESMPCGGGDIGMNVWVENGDLLFYFSRSGTFDENNTLLKLGRIRLKLTPNPFDGDYFKQELKLEEGRVIIEGKNKQISTRIKLWADVFNPIIHVEVKNNQKLKAEIFYENWRYQDREIRKNEGNQNSYKWAVPTGLKTKKDIVDFQENEVLFYHQNQGENIFDVTVRQQGMESVKEQMFNPVKNLTFGGKMIAKGFVNAGISTGIYADTDYKAWKLESKEPVNSANIDIYLHTSQTENIESWKNELHNCMLISQKKKTEKETLTWWKSFWNRSFIFISPENKTGKSYEIGQNYQLFRYMLACNASGKYPTKFNGGLFTFDPCYVDSTLRFTPDFRKWGGGTHTAQNQRLVYFPMLKSGDSELMKPQFDYYLQALPNAELRSKMYWNHDGACFTEQLENFGLPNPSEYGWKRPEVFDKGLEYNAWLEYQWDTALEFCFMILEEERYTGKNITEYIPLIESCLKFFDEHYQYLAKQRGRKALDENNKLVLYPGSACETYKMATNATSTVAALQTVASRLLELPEIQSDSTKYTRFSQLLNKIPEIRTREISGYKTIAPAWLWERINNTESPQLYPVFPWGIYGIGKPDLDVAINTWKYDPDVNKFRSHLGWKQDAIWAARLGLVDEAKNLIVKKMQNSTCRFPAFWGPGYDWTPDHNWGGSGAIALQEMLLQTDDEKIFILPCWPNNWDVHFKLNAPYNTTVECKFENGKIKLLKVLPENREKDIFVGEMNTETQINYGYENSY